MSAYDSFGAPGGLDVRRLLSLVKPDVLGWIDDALASADIEGLRFAANIDGQTVRPLAVLVTPPEGYSFVDLNRYGITLREEIGVAATALRFSENGGNMAAQIALDLPSLGSDSRLAIQNYDTATYTEPSIELSAVSLSHGTSVVMTLYADTDPRIESTRRLVIRNSAPSLVLTDSTASAKSLTLAVDANKADLRESAGGAGSLLQLDLANKTVGLGTAAQSNTSLSFGGSISSASNAFVMYTSGVSLDPADNFSALSLFAGGNTIVATAGQTVFWGIAAWLAGFAKSGSGSILETWSLYAEKSTVGTANRGAYFEGSVSIGTTSFGSSADKTLSLGNGTAPTTSITGAQVWSEANGLKVMKSGVALKEALPGGLATNTTDVGNVGTGEDDLMTYSVAASTLSADGDWMEFYCVLTFAANANSKRVRVKWGSTTIYDSGAQNQNGGSMVVHARVVRTGAATQDVFYSVNNSASSLYGTSNAAWATAAETLANAITFKVTGEAVSNNDILQRVFLPRHCPTA